MNVLKRIESWMKANFSSQQPPPPDPNLSKLHELIYRARMLKFAGEYDNVLAELDSILMLADEKMGFGVRINQADIFILKKDFDSAETLLKALDAQENLTDGYRAHLANKWGMWWKAQHKWDHAQERFEEAIELGKQSTHNNFVCLVTSHLAHVYLGQGNASYALHLMEQAFPTLQVNSELDIDSYFTGIYGLAMLQVGQPNGRQLLEHALKLAEMIGHHEYQLLWLNSLAIEALEANLFKESYEYFSRVLGKIALEDDLYIQTLCAMSRTAYHLDPETALRHAQKAEELMNDAYPERLKTQLSITLGIAYRINHDGEQALLYLKKIDEDPYRALKLSSSEYAYVYYLRNLAGTYLLISDLPKAEEVYERALNNPSFTEFEIANIQRDKGIYHVELKQYQEAIQLWMTALKYYETQHHYVQVARLYCDIGNIRRLMGQGRRAFKDYEQALMVLNSFDDPETRGIVLSNAATIYADFGDITTAESFFVEAIQIAQQLRNPRMEAIRRGNYGWFLLNTGRADSALHMLQHAVDQSKSLNMSLHEAVQIDNIGAAWHELKDYERALQYHNQSWQLLQTQTGIDAYWQGIVGANLAHSLISAQKLEAVDDLIDVVLKIGRDINRQELVVRALNAKIRLLLIETTDQEYLTILADEAVSLARLQGRRRLMADALILRNQVYKMIGRVDDATQDWESAKSILQLLRLKPADYQPSER